MTQLEGQIIQLEAKVVKTVRTDKGVLITEIALSPRMGFEGLSQEEVDEIGSFLFDNPMPMTVMEIRKREPIGIQACVIRPDDPA